MTVPVLVFTADHRLPELRAFLHLYKKYWNWPLTVFGFAQPDWKLEQNVKFFSMGNMSDYPADKWSDAVISALKTLDNELVIILLEDYLLTRHVNQQAILQLADYMRNHKDIVRADLTTDRLYAANLTELESLLWLDLIENKPPAPYHFSLQAGIWRREHLLYYMRPGETPWQSELNGTTRMLENDGYPNRVIGTRQYPVRYLIAVQGGKLALDGGYQVPKPYMSQVDITDTIRLIEMAKDNVTIAFAGMAG